MFSGGRWIAISSRDRSTKDRSMFSKIEVKVAGLINITKNRRLRTPLDREIFNGSVDAGYGCPLCRNRERKHRIPRISPHPSTPLGARFVLGGVFAGHYSTTFEGEKQ